MLATNFPLLPLVVSFFMERLVWLLLDSWFTVA